MQQQHWYLHWKMCGMAYFLLVQLKVGACFSRLWATAGMHAFVRLVPLETVNWLKQFAWLNYRGKLTEHKAHALEYGVFLGWRNLCLYTPYVYVGSFFTHHRVICMKNDLTYYLVAIISVSKTTKMLVNIKCSEYITLHAVSAWVQCISLLWCINSFVW